VKLESFYSSVPIFLLGVVIWIDYIFCGLFNTAGLFIGLFLLTAYLVGLYLFHIAMFVWQKKRINVVPLLIAGLFVSSVYCFDSISFKGKEFLVANNYEPYKIVNLYLFENGKLEVSYGHIHRICKCSGYYTKVGDTINVKDVTIPDKFRISKKYLISKVYIIPIFDGRIEKDSTQYLLIRK